jgi:hypothetical protein
MDTRMTYIPRGREYLMCDLNTEKTTNVVPKILKKRCKLWPLELNQKEVEQVFEATRYNK